MILEGTTKERWILDRWMTNLLRLETSEAEHANLVSNVLPVVSGALLFKVRYKHLPHLNYTVCHVLHLNQPIKQQNQVLVTLFS